MSASPRASARKHSGASCSAIVNASRGWLGAQRGGRRRDELGQPGGEAGDADGADDPLREAATSAAAASSWASTTFAWPTSTSAALVRRMPRPLRSSTGWPTSRSSAASCWDTADGVRCSASAAAASVPCWATSRRTRRRRASIIQAQLTGSAAQCLLALMSRRRRMLACMPARSVALVVLVAAVWGVNFVVIHVGLDHFPPLLFNALRFTVMARAGDLPRRPPAGRRGATCSRFGFLLGVVKFGLLFVTLDLGMPAGLSSLLLQLQVIFTIVFAGVRAARAAAPRADGGRGDRVRRPGGDRDRPRGQRAGPPVPAGPRRRRGVGRDQRDDARRAAARPARDARLGQPGAAAPAARALAAVRGPAEIGDALGGHRRRGDRPRSLFVALVSGLFGFAAWTTLLKRHSAAAVTPFALLVPVFGIGERGAAARRAAERARARRRGADLRRAGGDAAAGARARAGGAAARPWRRSARRASGPAESYEMVRQSSTAYAGAPYATPRSQRSPRNDAHLNSEDA